MSLLPTAARAPVFVAATLAAYAVFAWLVIRAGVAVRTRLGARLARLEPREAALLNPQTIERWSLRALAVAKVVLLLAGAYAALVLVLIATGASRTVFDLVTRPLITMGSAALESVLEFIPSALMLLVVVVVTRIVAGVVRQFFSGPHRLFLPNFDPSLVLPTKRIALFLVWVLGTVIGAPFLPGFGSRAFQGVTIFLGLIVSLGSSSLVGNLLAGLQLTYSRSYNEGDRVRIGEVYGDVLELGIFATKLRTIQNAEVTVPNALVQTWSVTNFSRSRHLGLEVDCEVTIGYQTPWRTVHELLLAAARATRGVRAGGECYVLQRALGDFYVRYQLNAQIEDPSLHHLIASDLNANILDTFHRAGVEICSPHYTALRDGNGAAIPAEPQAPRGS